MIKLFTGLFIIVTALHSNSSQSRCLNDLKAISDNYYSGVKLEYINNYDEAIDLYRLSISSSYNAIQSCQYHIEYNPNDIYDYITASEIKINTLQEKQF